MIKFFSSIKVSIFLLVIIILATTLGTLIPQGRSAEAYTEKYGNWAPFLIKSGITRLYQSPWYLFLLILFSINITVCSLTRIKKKFIQAFKPQIMTEEKKLETLSLKKSFTHPQSVPQAEKRLKEILSSKGYKVQGQSTQGRHFILARKRYLGLFGSDIVHLGILIVIMGGFITGAAGFRENVALAAEETKSVPGADFSLKLNRFETYYYKDGSVKDWKSTLSVIKNSQNLLTKTIEVNHPLSFKGFVFYQSGYGWDWRNPEVELVVERKTEKALSRSIRTRVGEKISIKEEEIEIEPVYFVPDFVLTKENKVTTRSLEPNNPAVYVRASEKGESVFSGWLFLKYPGFNTGSPQRDSVLSVEFKDFKAEPYSIIQIARDPGAPFIWAGCFLVMSGLFLAFYYTPRQLRFLIKKEKQDTKISAGGTAKKAKDSFKREFDKILGSFRRSG